MFKAIICDIQGVLVDIANGEDINAELVDFLVKNKKDYGLLLLYSNLGEQSAKILKQFLPELFEIVDKAYYASDVKYRKPDPKGFEEILNEWNLKPEEVVFIDDNDVNIKAAKSLGIQTVHYENFESFSILESLFY